MPVANVLEVAIGLVMVYYVLGLVVSFISKMIMESFETRGKVLEEYLKAIVGDRKISDLLANPQIKSQAPVRYNHWYGLLKSRKPDVKGGYFDEVRTKVEKVPVSNLVDAFFDVAELAGQAFTADELIQAVKQLPQPTQEVLLPKIQAGVTKIEDLRSTVATWFTGLMDQASATYKAYARRFVILLAVLVTLVTGIDSIELANKLNQDANFRALVNARAQALVQQGEADTKVEEVMAEVESLSLRIGWLALPQTLPSKDAGAGEISVYCGTKLLGLALTAAAVSQGSSFWYDILKKLTSTSLPKEKPEEAGAA